MNIKKTLKYVKFNESKFKFVLGILVLLVVGTIVFKNYSRKSDNNFTTLIGDEESQETHKVEKGETLWSIAEDYYGTGYKWVDIAEKNKIEDPSKLAEGQTIDVPQEEKLATENLNNPANTMSASTEAKTHIVAKGETLWSIAENYYGSGYNWVDVASVNKIKNPSTLKTGEELLMPNVNPKKITKETATTLEPKAISGANYTVEKGDTLWSIAIRAYGDGYKWTKIASENGLQNPNVIFAGDTLSLPR
jgi:nucleoid-associated protein YgaU